MRRIIIKMTKIPIYKDIYTRIIYIIFLWSYAKKKKTNEKLTNCKLLLCIWILNKKTNLNSTNNFKFSNTHLNAGPIQQQICKNIDSLFVWMRLSLWFRVSLSLSSQRRQTTCGGGALSLSISLSHFTAQQYQTCACSARSLHRSLSITHDRLSRHHQHR